MISTQPDKRIKNGKISLSTRCTPTTAHMSKGIGDFFVSVLSAIETKTIEFDLS